MHGAHVDLNALIAGAVPRNKPERIAKALYINRHRSLDSWKLTQLCETTAISTRVSEVNQALRRARAGWFVRCTQVGKGFFYQLVEA